MREPKKMHIDGRKDYMTFDIHQKFAAYKKRMEAKLAAKDKEISDLKKLVYCKHLKESLTRIDGGYECKCLDCGFEWVKMDKPLTEIERHNKAMFNNWQRHNEWREEQGLKPEGCE